MFGAGHVADMNARIKQNRALLKEKSFFKNKESFKITAKKKNICLKKASKEQLKEIRIAIIKEQKQKLIKTIIAFLITIIISFLVIVAIIKGVMYLFFNS